MAITPVFTIMVLSGIAASVGTFAIIFDVNDYWEEREIIRELSNKNKELDEKREQILMAYTIGSVSKDTSISKLELLLNETNIHLKDIEEKVTFLNVSHNFKNANKVIQNIEDDIRFLQKIN